MAVMSVPMRNMILRIAFGPQEVLDGWDFMALFAQDCRMRRCTVDLCCTLHLCLGVIMNNDVILNGHKVINRLRSFVIGEGMPCLFNSS